MSKKTGSDAAPVWHGNDKSAAIKRAKEIDGYVILSRGPGETPENGYWSDPIGLVRNWETLVYPK